MDRDNYCNDIVIENPEIYLRNNTIWRLYPINSKYIPKEIRPDKIKPNPRNIVNNLICIKYYLSSDFKDEIYYNDVKFKYNSF